MNIKQFLRTSVSIVLLLVVMMVPSLLLLGISKIIDLDSENNLVYYFGTVTQAILYGGAFYLLIKILAKYWFKEDLNNFRIVSFGIKKGYVIFAGILIFLVYFLFLLLPGEIRINTFTNELLRQAFRNLILGGVIASFIEEIIFRGFMMKTIEESYNNKYVSIIIPSIIFSVLHLLNGGLDVISFLQLLLSGTLVGILFSVMVYEFNSIWAGIFLHFCWNTVSILFPINSSFSNDVIIQYVSKGNNIFFGGEYGFESGVIACGCYLITIIAVLISSRKKQKY